MKTIITSGRNYTMTNEDLDMLDKIRAKHGFMAVILRDGMSAGDNWCAWRGVPFRKFNINEEAHGQIAAEMRDRLMVDEADMAIILPRAFGLLHSMALGKGIPIYTESPNGVWKFTDEKGSTKAAEL